jgi:predicted membrane protein
MKQINKIIDHPVAEYTFIGTRKHFFMDQKYYIYIFSDKIVMSIVSFFHIVAI